MPLPSCACEIEAPTCCGWLFADAETMLAAVYARLADCLPEPDECTGPALDVFVSHGPPALTRSDYLTVWLEYIRLTAADKATRTYEISWVMLLTESGYPGFKNVGNELTEPTIEQLAAVNEHVYAHLAMLTDAVFLAHSNGELLPAHGCGTVRLSEIVPATGGNDVQGYSAGARLRITYSRTW